VKRNDEVARQYFQKYFHISQKIYQGLIQAARLRFLIFPGFVGVYETCCLNLRTTSFSRLFLGQEDVAIHTVLKIH